jgi:hypothetical protein
MRIRITMATLQTRKMRIRITMGTLQTRKMRIRITMGTLHEWQVAQAATSSPRFKLRTDLEGGVPNLAMASWKASRFGVRRP